MSYAVQKIDFEKETAPPSNFIKLKAGDNIFRIVSDAYWLRKHTVREYGKFMTSLCKGKNCQLCEQGLNPSLRFSAIVLDRETGQVGLVDIPAKIGAKILDLGRKEDVRTFDILVRREGSGVQTKYPKVEKAGVKEVSPEERAQIQEVMPILKNRYFSE